MTEPMLNLAPISSEYIRENINDLYSDNREYSALQRGKETIGLFVLEKQVDCVEIGFRATDEFIGKTASKAVVLFMFDFINKIDAKIIKTWTKNRGMTAILKRSKAKLLEIKDGVHWFIWEKE